MDFGQRRKHRQGFFFAEFKMAMFLDSKSILGCYTSTMRQQIGDIQFFSDGSIRVVKLRKNGLDRSGPVDLLFFNKYSERS